MGNNIRIVIAVMAIYGCSYNIYSNNGVVNAQKQEGGIIWHTADVGE